MLNSPRQTNISGSNVDIPKGKGTLPIFALEKITERKKAASEKEEIEIETGTVGSTSRSDMRPSTSPQRGDHRRHT